MLARFYAAENRECESLMMLAEQCKHQVMSASSMTLETASTEQEEQPGGSMEASTALPTAIAVGGGDTRHALVAETGRLRRGGAFVVELHLAGVPEGRHATSRAMFLSDAP
jgi:hypothetical protein